MAAPGSLDMEAFQTMMRAWVDEISTKQTENINAKLKEQTENLTANLNELRQDNVQLKDKLNKKIYKQTEDLKEDLNNTLSELKHEITNNTMQLVNKINNTNTHIAAVETTIETMLCEQTIIIESKREQTFIINDDNSSEIINTCLLYTSRCV